MSQSCGRAEGRERMGGVLGWSRQVASHLWGGRGSRHRVSTFFYRNRQTFFFGHKFFVYFSPVTFNNVLCCIRQDSLFCQVTPRCTGLNIKAIYCLERGHRPRVDPAPGTAGGRFYKVL